MKLLTLLYKHEILHSVQSNVTGQQQHGRFPIQLVNMFTERHSLS